MKTPTRWIARIAMLALFVGLFFWVRHQPSTASDSTNSKDHLPLSAGEPAAPPANNVPTIIASKGTNLAPQFSEWAKDKQIGVDFLNPPKVDNEGLFCVINPEYQFKGKKITEIVEDGTWYSNALAGARGAILIGKGNGRPPWSYVVGELFIEDNELQLRHRIAFGGNKGVRTRLLIDLEEKSVVSKIGIAMDEMVPGSPWGYPPISYDEKVITSEEVESTPLQTIKPNWIELDTNFDPTKTFKEPVRVIWLQFQESGRKIIQISN